MKQVNVGIIGTEWCGGIRAVAAANEPHLARLTMEAYLAADLSAEIDEPVDLPLTKEMAERAFVASVKS